jgi:hypothetical protein
MSVFDSELDMFPLTVVSRRRDISCGRVRHR